MDKSEKYISIIQVFEDLAKEIRDKRISPASDIVTKASNATFEYCASLIEVRISVIKDFMKTNKTDNGHI